MKIKTSELKDLALDYLVAKCEGRGFVFGETDYTDGHTYQRGTAQATGPHYSTNWAQGGPLIEREKINVSTYGGLLQWIATKKTGETFEAVSGPTPLIAAMRCYVASKLGDEVEIPEELAP
jgi:hypothetical protein